MRLAKYLSLTGLCSRRAATRYIRDGRISIDGRLANHIDQISVVESCHGQVAAQQLTFDGQLVPPIEAKQYWLYHKPVGVDCRLLPELSCSLIHQLPSHPRLYPVGRLDKDSRGLLLLTNDGELTQRLLHPQYHHSKRYLVTLNKDYDAQFLTKMAQGVSYRGITTLPCQTAPLIGETDRFEIILTQGLNRQIRRMSQALGYRVIDLKRVQLASLKLGELTEGDMRALTQSELALLIED